MPPIARRGHDPIEMPMGPMIDMVFLLLVFFMATARAVKPEADLGLSLPGTVEQDAPVDLPDEQRVHILPDGRIVLNDTEIDSPASRDLPQLRAVLGRFKETCAANQTEALVTLHADDAAKHQRIADVMDAAAAAGIVGLTFATDGDDEGS